MTSKRNSADDLKKCLSSTVLYKIKRVNIVTVPLLCVATLTVIYLKDPYLQLNKWSSYAAKENCFNNSGKISNIKRIPCMRNYFKDYLLVIVYNHPHFDSVELLGEFYRPVFPNIYFCGPISNISHENISQFHIDRGIYGYHCLASAFREKFWLKGYFYINDDVILNYWNLVNENFDGNSIWQSSYQFGRVELNGESPSKWYWWVSPYGFKNTKYAVQEIYNHSTRFSLFKSLFSTFIKNGKGKMYANNGRSDIAYIPRKYMTKFQELSNIFYRHKVFLEIAFPTILRFLTNESNIKTMRGYYIPGDVRKNDKRVIDSRYFWTSYLANYKLWFIHPFKLHHNKDKNRDLNLALMKEVLIERTNKYTNC